MILSRRLCDKAQRFATYNQDSRVRRKFAIQQPDFQLLSTCKQVYNEGRDVFYVLPQKQLPSTT